jgi:hypothetical protein
MSQRKFKLDPMNLKVVRGGAKTREDKEIELKDSMGQNWTSNSYSRYYQDQFGFVIYYAKNYRLEYRGRAIATVHSLVAAKLISTIILNDIISNKKF